MFLIENGYFGDPNPDVNSLHKLLVVAYADFKKFQKERGISCSQGKFVPNFVTRLHEQVSRFGFGAACLTSTTSLVKVWKPDKHGAHMSHKGYNGRVIAMWLYDCMERAAHHRISEGRSCGQWLHEQHETQGLPWPDNDDERFAPICVAMTLAFCSVSILICAALPLAVLLGSRQRPQPKPAPRSQSLRKPLKPL